MEQAKPLKASRHHAPFDEDALALAANHMSDDELLSALEKEIRGYEVNADALEKNLQMWAADYFHHGHHNGAAHLREKIAFHKTEAKDHADMAERLTRIPDCKKYAQREDALASRHTTMANVYTALSFSKL